MRQKALFKSKWRVNKMTLSKDVQSLLEQNGFSNLESLKGITREDLKNCKLDNQQIQQVIIYLQLHGLDVKRSTKKKCV